MEPEAAKVFDRLAGPDGLTAQASTFMRSDVVQALAEAYGATASAPRIEQLADAFLASDRVCVLAPTGAGAGYR